MKTLALAVDWKKQMILVLLSALMFGFMFVALAHANHDAQVNQTESYSYGGPTPNGGSEQYSISRTTQTGGNQQYGGAYYPQPVYNNDTHGEPSIRITSGGAVGAVIGVGIGSRSKHSGSGAAIGGGIGYVVGRIFIDPLLREVERATEPRPAYAQAPLYRPIPRPQYFHGPVDRGPAPQPPQRDCGSEFCSHR